MDMSKIPDHEELGIREELCSDCFNFSPENFWLHNYFPNEYMNKKIMLGVRVGIKGIVAVVIVEIFVR